MKSLLPAVLCTLLIGALACRDVPTAGLPENVEVRLANPVAWPGSDLVIVSSALTGSTALPEVMLDTLHLAVTRADDSTVTARLPDTSGVFPLHLRLFGGDRFGTVRIAGYVSRTDAPPFTGWPLPMSPGSPIVMVAAARSLVRFDLRSGVTTSPWSIAHSAVCSASPGPSYRLGGVVSVPRSMTPAFYCARAVSWLGAFPVDSAPGVSIDVRLWAELSPGVWLKATSQDLWIFRSGQTVLFEPLVTERLVFSPDRSYVVPLPARAPWGGLPVFEAATGTVAYRLPLDHTWAAAYTPGGDTIFATGNAPSDYVTRHLMTISTASRQVVADVTDSLPVLSDLMLDPDGPWLYGVEMRDGPIIHVYDRGTLRHLQSLRPPAACRQGLDCGGQVILAIDPSTRRVYVLDVLGWGDIVQLIPSAVTTFDLPPVTQVAQVLSP